MTVMITGAGLVGCQAARVLVEMGEKPLLFELVPKMDIIKRIVDVDKVKIVRGDILEPMDLIKVIQEEKVDRIIHTVTMFGMSTTLPQKPYAGIKVNVMGTATVLEVARMLDIKRVVYTSSSTVYLRPHFQPEGPTVTEDFPVWILSGRSPNIYAITKLMGEELGLNYLDAYGLDFVTVRFTGVFGPWLGPISGLTGVRVHDMIEKALSGKPIILGEGWPADRPMDMVYSKDAGRSIVLACFAKEPKQRTYNISMATPYSPAEVAQVVKKLIPSVEIQHKKALKASGPGFPSLDKPIDISKAKEELGYEPQYPLEAALRDYIQWLRDNQI